MAKHLGFKSSKGMSLLEVLITLVIVAVGLLGIAGIQLVGLRYANAANLRYQATIQAIDMADRMRANEAGVDLGSYDNISGTPSDPNCISSGCTPSQMATTDAFQWNTANARVLPGGSGTVVGNNNVFTITVSWNEMGGIATAAARQNFVLTVAL